MRDGLRHGQSVQRDRAPMGVHIGYVESNRHGQMGGGRQRRFSYDGAGRSMVHSEVVGRGHLEKHKGPGGKYQTVRRWVYRQTSDRAAAVAPQAPAAQAASEEGSLIPIGMAPEEARQRGIRDAVDKTRFRELRTS